ncbi:MAG: nucleoside 2-deoxyribosyltransferase [Rhodomicrobium sp.]
MTYNLLVLGPMQHRVGDTVIRQSNTKRIGEILDQMSQALAVSGVKPFRAVTPEDPNESAIIELVMSEIEQADLVVLDLTGNRPSVAYEAGIIHALGIPYIFVTEDEETSFYFSSVRVVRGLQIQADFDAQNPGPSQGELFGRLKTFLSGADARTAMAGNILTSHFEGLPIIDLAGPAGMAASYYTNAVKRFIRPGGFAGRRCELLFKEDRPARFGSKTVTSTRSVSATVNALIAVEPPSQLAKSFFEDDVTLKAALKELGVELERATIAAAGTLDKRDYGGWFDKRGIARGSTVCIEIPTIVYPLTESPRILRLRKRRSKFEGEQRQIMQEVEERALEKMLASFKRNLFYHIDMESEANKAGFYYVPLRDLPAALRKAGVL